MNPILWSITLRPQPLEICYWRICYAVRLKNAIRGKEGLEMATGSAVDVVRACLEHEPPEGLRVGPRSKFRSPASRLGAGTPGRPRLAGAIFRYRPGSAPQNSSP